MKLTSIAFAGLVALAAAAPSGDRDDRSASPSSTGSGYPPHPPPPPPNGGKCTPATYACTTNPQTGGPGWKVCNTSGRYEYGGDCPPDTVCKFFDPSKSPYCVPPDFEFP